MHLTASGTPATRKHKAVKPVNKVKILSIYKSQFMYVCVYIVMDLNNALPGNSSVNTIQQATLEEALFSVDPIDAPINWLNSDHMICVYSRSLSVPGLYK
jgi:hypothetical protein